MIHRNVALFFSAALILFCNVVNGQFNGIVEFVKIRPGDTTSYIYYIKGKNIRVEEKKSDGTIAGIMLVNTEEGTVYALSPERKLYMDVTNTRGGTPINGKLQKTNEHKKVLGYDCVKWLVTDKARDVSIEYWMSGNDFDFFYPLLKTLNRKDNLSRYFLQLEGVEGMFPIHGVEKAGDGSIRMELYATKIEARDLRGAMFVIPKGYTKFEK